MKRNVTLTISTILLIALASCGDAKNKEINKISKQEELETNKASTPVIVEASFSDEMIGKVFNVYQQIRIALVNSNAEEVNLAAGNLVQSLTVERNEMKSLGMAMAESNDIEEQRKLFSQLTTEVESLFKESISDGEIYKQYCPMAFEGKGGYWISNVEEIRNPYYGDKMLKCGKVTEIIN